MLNYQRVRMIWNFCCCACSLAWFSIISSLQMHRMHRMHRIWTHGSWWYMTSTWVWQTQAGVPHGTTNSTNKWGWTTKTSKSSNCGWPFQFWAFSSGDTKKSATHRSGVSRVCSLREESPSLKIQVKSSSLCRKNSLNLVNRYELIIIN